MKTCVLMEKWCDLEPRHGITSGNSNLLGSLISSGLTETTTFYYDEYLQTNGHAIDEFLLEKLQEKPDFLVVSYYPVAKDHRNVRRETFQTIKNMGIPIIFFWFDTIHPHIRNLACDLSQYAKLSILIDGTEVPNNNNYLSLWVPQDQNVFFKDDSIYQDIEVTFCGSTNQYADRRKYIAHVIGQGVPLTVTGGQREHALPIEEYAKILKRSKISVNFCTKPDGAKQAKSRIYETMLCGAMLLEENGEPIKKWFEPMVHYVPFNNEIDLVNKIRYYLNHEEERSIIAKNGLDKMSKCYNSTIFWQQVFEKAKNEFN